MAEHAQQEPTMEEILSSIRKIIADDEPPRGAPEAAVSANVVDVREADDDAFDDLDLSFDEIVDELPETEDDVLSAITQSDSDSDVFDPISSFDDLMESPRVDVAEEDAFEAEAEEVDFEVMAEPVYSAHEDEKFEDSAAIEAGEPEEELAMNTDAIADSRTVNAAAGSLGKLLSKVEFGEAAGGNNTIEGVVREMLRPMLKEWLDENLPKIVERSVEAEVQRIARMAR